MLEGAELVVHVSRPVTDEQILGALGKRVTSKVSRIGVITDWGKDGRLRALRWINV